MRGLEGVEPGREGGSTDGVKAALSEYESTEPSNAQAGKLCPFRCSCSTWARHAWRVVTDVSPDTISFALPVNKQVTRHVRGWIVPNKKDPVQMCCPVSPTPLTAHVSRLPLCT